MVDNLPEPDKIGDMKTKQERQIMKKLTPKDTFGALVTSTSNFQKKKYDEVVGGDDGFRATKDHYRTTEIPKLDVTTFGQYFTRCCQLNSILKKGAIIDNAQLVMKDKLGYRALNCGNPYGNAKYATDDQIFAFIKAGHKDLLCKKERKVIFQDFYDLKIQVNEKLEVLKSNMIDKIDEEIQISEVYEVKYDLPVNNGYGQNPIGHVEMNHRNISRDDIFINMTCNDFDNEIGFNAPRLANIVDVYTNKRNSIYELSICVGFKERQIKETHDAFGEPKTEERVVEYDLVSCNIKPTRGYDGYSVRVYNHQFSGIDINKIHTEVVAEYINISNWFDDELKILRDKYSAEYTMWELVYGNDSAI